jgi:hypothetical protein
MHYETSIFWQAGDQYTWVFEYSAEIALEREEDGEVISYTGTEPMKVDRLEVIPGECQGTLSASREGLFEVTIPVDLTMDEACKDLFVHLGTIELPTETGTLQCDPDQPPQTLPEVVYGWSAWLTAHTMAGGQETGFMLSDWECAPEGSDIMATKEYTLVYSMEEMTITVEVRAKLVFD